jgi:hypothetical protein
MQTLIFKIQDWISALCLKVICSLCALEMRYTSLLVAVLMGVICKRALGDCVDNGTCEPCPPDQMGSPECTLTGRRMPLICKHKRVDYRSCTLKDDQLQVLVFQLIVGLTGALAYWGVQVKKARNMSLFDKRRKGASNGNFLAI